MDYEEDESKQVYTVAAQIVAALCILTVVGVVLMGAAVLIGMVSS